MQRWPLHRNRWMKWGKTEDNPNPAIVEDRIASHWMRGRTERNHHQRRNQNRVIVARDCIPSPASAHDRGNAVLHSRTRWGRRGRSAWCRPLRRAKETVQHHQTEMPMFLNLDTGAPTCAHGNAMLRLSVSTPHSPLQSGRPWVGCWPSMGHRILLFRSHRQRFVWWNCNKHAQSTKDVAREMSRYTDGRGEDKRAKAVCI
jgi:hypothetical protein